jgi:hypothetical protein
LKKVTAYLQGGIGNQLFILFAAYSVAIRMKNSEVYLDKSLLSISQIQHPGNLGDMEIRVGGEVLNFHSKRFKKPVMLINTQRLLYKIAFACKPLRRFLPQYRSKVFGFDPLIQTLRSPISIVGYFQTYKYFDDISSNSKIEITPRDPSEWFKATSFEINQAGSTVGIHLRRGDYAAYKSTLGMLADEYFIQVLSTIGLHEKVDKIYIFSDSLDAAELLKQKISNFKCEVVVPPDSVSPAESLLLISHCTFKIISNSTFSWWSGYLSKSPSTIFAPIPWYLNHVEPEALVPDEWRRVQSIWVQ